MGRTDQLVQLRTAKRGHAYQHNTPQYGGLASIEQPPQQHGQQSSSGSSSTDSSSSVTIRSQSSGSAAAHHLWHWRHPVGA